MFADQLHEARQAFPFTDDQGRPTAMAHVSVLAASALLLCSQFLVSWNSLLYTPYSWDSDLLQEFYPWRVFVARSLAAGHLPLWDHHVFGGAPVLSNIQLGLFYPLNVLFFLLPANVAFNWGFAALVFVAGLSTYALLREFDVSGTGSLIGGVAFMLGDVVTARILAGHYPVVATLVLVPLVFLAYERALVTRTRWSMALPGVVVAAQFFGGYLQGVYLTLVAIGCYVVVREWSSLRAAPRETTATIVRLFALSGVTALLLSAIQLVPTLYASRFTARSGGFAYGDMWSHTFDPPLLVTTTMPTLLDGIHAYPWEYSFYLGIAPLLLAPFALARVRADARVRALLAVGLLSLVLAFGPWTPIYWLYHSFVPGADLFRAPNRFVAFVALTLSVFAGIGYDVIRDDATPIPRRVWDLMSGIVVTQLILFVVLVGLFGLGLATLLPVSIPKLSLFATRADAILWEAALAVLFSMLTIGFLLGLRHHAGMRSVFATGLTLLVIVNLLLYQAPDLGARPVSEIYATEGVPFYGDVVPTGRVYDAGTLVEDRWYSGARSGILAEEVNTVHGVDSIGGYNPLNLGQSFDRYALLGAGPGSNEALLDALNVSHVIVAANDSEAYLESGGYTLVTAYDESVVDQHVRRPARYGDTVVLRNDDALGRAYFVAGDAVPDPTDVASVDAAQSLAFERDGSRMRVAGTFGSAGYVVISENHYPLWVATVDGDRVAIERTEGDLMAVPVTAGAHEVELRYDPWPAKLGAGLSGLGLGWLGLLWWTGRRGTTVD